MDEGDAEGGMILLRGVLVAASVDSGTAPAVEDGASAETLRSEVEEDSTVDDVCGELILVDSDVVSAAAVEEGERVGSAERAPELVSAGVSK